MTENKVVEKNYFFKKWLGIVREWLELRFGDKQQNYEVQIIGRFREPKSSLLLLTRNTPGAVSTWQLNWTASLQGDFTRNRSLFITLDNLTDLKRHFKRTERQKNPLDINREFVQRKSNEPSHGLQISFIDTSRRIKTLVAWEFNFIDQWASRFAEDKKAEIITLSIARRTQRFCKLSQEPDFDPLFFEEQISKIDWWEEGIRQACEGNFSASHQFNPKRIKIVEEDSGRGNPPNSKPTSAS